MVVNKGTPDEDLVVKGEYTVNLTEVTYGNTVWLNTPLTNPVIT